MDPVLRRWWRLLEEFPGRLARVERWDTVQLPPDEADGGHLHSVPSLVACLAGVIRAQAPGRHLDLHPGEALVIAPGVWHLHAPTRAGSVFFAQGFLPTGSDVVIGDHQRRFHGRLPGEPSRRLMDRVLAAAVPAERSARLADLLVQVLSETVENQDSSNQALRRMVHRMWSSLHRGVTVADLVQASGLSRAQAYRLFTQGYGVPPKMALASARLGLAAGLLASGLGVGETARRCGYPTPCTFARAWKRQHGQAPQSAVSRLPRSAPARRG